MEHLGLTKEESIDLLKKSVSLAHTARERFLTKNGKTLKEANGS